LPASAARCPHNSPTSAACESRVAPGVGRSPNDQSESATSSQVRTTSPLTSTRPSAALLVQPTASLTQLLNCAHRLSPPEQWPSRSTKLSGLPPRGRSGCGPTAPVTGPDPH